MITTADKSGRIWLDEEMDFLSAPVNQLENMYISDFYISTFLYFYVLKFGVSLFLGEEMGSLEIGIGPYQQPINLEIMTSIILNSLYLYFLV